MTYVGSFMDLVGSLGSVTKVTMVRKNVYSIKEQIMVGKRNITVGKDLIPPPHNLR